MAFTTGPDFLSGILGASNSTDVLNKFKSDTGQEDFYQGLRNRYGERIGDDGYLDGGVGTYDFIDSDRDGIDDRHQAGPGQPKAGSNPDGNPIFGGGNLPPNAGGDDNPNSPLNNRPVADYNPNLVGQYFGYNNPEYGMGLTYNNSSNVDPANETGFLEGFDIKNFLPGSFIAKGLAKGLGALEKNFFPETLKDNLDKLTPEAFKERYGDFMDKYGTEQATTKDLTDMSPEEAAAYFDRLTDTPGLTSQEQVDQYRDRQAEKEQAEREERDRQAEQDRINNAVESGYLGFGQDEDGDYGGLVTGGPLGTYVNTGYNPNVQNENYHNMFSQAEKEAANNLGAMQQSYGSIAAGLNAQAAKNKARRDKNKNQGSGSSGSSGSSSSGSSNSIGGCFIKGTMVEMADGTEKEITSINVGEETKGGTVQAKMEYMPHSIYDYKGVKVSGSHWVMEDGQFTEVENSKHAVLTDMIEPVYNFMTSKHRIFIKGVEFGGFYSQDPDYYEPYFKQEKIKINKELSEKTT